MLNPARAFTVRGNRGLSFDGKHYIFSGASLPWQVDSGVPVGCWYITYLGDLYRKIATGTVQSSWEKVMTSNSNQVAGVFGRQVARSLSIDSGLSEIKVEKKTVTPILGVTSTVDLAITSVSIWCDDKVAKFSIEKVTGDTTGWQSDGATSFQVEPSSFSRQQIVFTRLVGEEETMTQVPLYEPIAIGDVYQIICRATHDVKVSLAVNLVELV